MELLCFILKGVAVILSGVSGGRRSLNTLVIITFCLVGLLAIIMWMFYRTKYSNLLLVTTLLNEFWSSVLLSCSVIEWYVLVAIYVG